MHPDPEAHRDRGRRHLPAELLPPAQAAKVVDRTDGRRNGCTEQQSARLAGEIEKRERRDEDSKEKREPAEAWHRAAVEAPALRPVDGAEQPRHPADCRRQEDDDRRSEQRTPDDLQVIGEGLQHLYFVP